jgi:heptosyltransferase-1
MLNGPAHSSAEIASIKSILVVKLGAIGDVVTASVLLPAIRARCPAAAVTWMAGSAGAQILRLLDEKIEIFTVDDAALFSGSRREQIGEIFRIAFSFRLRSFDRVLVPYRNRLYLALCLGVRTKKLRAF